MEKEDIIEDAFLLWIREEIRRRMKIAYDFAAWEFLYGIPCGPPEPKEPVELLSIEQLFGRRL